MSPKSGVLLNSEVAKHLALAGQSKVATTMVRWKAKSPTFDGGHGTDVTENSHRTSTARAEASAMNSFGNAVVEGSSCREEHSAEIGVVFTFNR